MAGNGTTKRLDKNRKVLRKGESYRESDGRYSFRWTDTKGKRHNIYAKTLTELRNREEEALKDQLDGIRPDGKNLTLNDTYETWKNVKRGIKDRSRQYYIGIYNRYIWPTIGKMKLREIKKSDVVKLYNSLAEEQGLSLNSIHSVQTALHQIFDIAVEDGYIRTNPADNSLKEINKELAFATEKKKALTKGQEKAFLDYVRNSPTYIGWYPIFKVMLGTGMRISEVVGLQWSDIDLEQGLIDVNHTLVYYEHPDPKSGERSGCFSAISTTKTPSSVRIIPMFEDVKEAFRMEKARQEGIGIKCRSNIDGYDDFIFLNKDWRCFRGCSVNRELKRIIKSYNKEAEKNGGVPLPEFTCHVFRHTFATRMCEAGMNIKVLQEVLGHTNISTTMDIYTDATKDYKMEAFRELENGKDDAADTKK